MFILYILRTKTITLWDKKFDQKINERQTMKFNLFIENVRVSEILIKLAYILKTIWIN